MNRAFKNSAVWFAAMAFLATGCLSRNFADSAPSLKTDVQSITAISGGDVTEQTKSLGVYPTTVVDTVLVTANQTWSAKITPEEANDWITLSEDEHMNLSGASESVQLFVNIQRNKAAEAREAVLTITTESITKVIPITQVALSRQLPAPKVYTTGKVAAKDPSDIYPIEDTCVVRIVCNTSWNATIMEGSTADISLKSNAGEDDSDLVVYFGENTDQENPKTAQVKIEAPGCEPQIIQFTQPKGFPYITVPDTFDRMRDVLEREFSFPIRTNSDWTAEMVADSTTFLDPVLAKVSGTKDDKEVKFTCTHGRNPGTKLARLYVKLHVEPNAEGAHLDDTLEVFQPGSLHLDFNDLVNPGNTSSPYSHKLSREFSYPSKTVGNSAANQKSTTGMTTSTSYPSWGGVRREFVTLGRTFKVPVYGDKGFWMNSPRQCFIIASLAKTGLAYIAAPALPGLTLKQIVYEPSWLQGGAYVRVRETDENGGAELEGGAKWKGTGATTNKQYVEHAEVHVFDLEGTKPATEYWVTPNPDGTSMYTKEIAFIYE